jgi:hypothetical protein
MTVNQLELVAQDLISEILLKYGIPNQVDLLS